MSCSNNIIEIINRETADENGWSNEWMDDEYVDGETD